MDTDNAAGTHGTDYRSPAPFLAAVSRRRFLQAGGALAGAAAVGRGQPLALRRPPPGGAAAPGRSPTLSTW